MTRTFCLAKTKSSNDGTYECKLRPIAGGTRCIKHGAGTKQAKAKAHERLALGKAQRHLEALGDTAPHRDSYEALQAVGNQASLLLDLLSGVVSQLHEFRYEGDHGENIRGELQAYMTAMARAESVHSKIISLGLEERRLTIDEAKIALIVAALDKALDQRQLNLSTEQKKLALAVVVKELNK
jgi:hypothetical protein